jgi:glycosyltransferase involved in cell wall biosynthesis
MRISVVIPAFNSERYVAEAIESVLSQTHPADEIIVVDDGSTDATPAVLREFGSRITVLRQVQSGPATALNAGIARCTGDLLAFQDADDLWVPNKLKLQHSLLSAEPEIEAVFGAARQFISPDLNDREVSTAAPEKEQAGIHKGAMLIRRSAFDRIGPFDVTLQVVEFGEWYARAIALGLRTFSLSELLVRRRLHASNLGRLRRDEQRSEQLLALKRSLDLRRAKS